MKKFRKYQDQYSESVWYLSLTERDLFYANVEDKTGFCGDTITFPLEDGTEDHVEGPWRSNTESFQIGTGVDPKEIWDELGVLFSPYGE